jgi:hypothetical protein
VRNPSLRRRSPLDEPYPAPLFTASLTSPASSLRLPPPRQWRCHHLLRAAGACGRAQSVAMKRTPKRWVEQLSLGGSQQAVTETPKQTWKDPPGFVLEVQEQGPNCLCKLSMVPFPLLVTFASILNASCSFIASAGFRRDEERA